MADGRPGGSSVSQRSGRGVKCGLIPQLSPDFARMRASEEEVVSIFHRVEASGAVARGDDRLLEEVLPCVEPVEVE